MAASAGPSLEGETVGVLRILVDGDTEEILGATILGLQADDLIQMIGLAHAGRGALPDGTRRAADPPDHGRVHPLGAPYLELTARWGSEPGSGEAGVPPPELHDGPGGVEVLGHRRVAAGGGHRPVVTAVDDRALQERRRRRRTPGAPPR